MPAYEITSHLTNMVSGNHNSLHTGIVSALQFAQMTQHLVLSVEFTGPETASVSTKDGVLLFSVAAKIKRPPGRPPSDVARSTEPKAPPTPKPYRFSGRPTISGWLKCEKVCELNLEAAQAMWNKRTYKAVLVYMARDGSPLALEGLYNPMDELVARVEKAKAMGVGRYARTVAEVACEIAEGSLLPTPPEGAVALFVLGERKDRLEIYGKRLLEGLVLRPFSPLPLKPATPLQALVDVEAARKAQERYEAQQRGEYISDLGPDDPMPGGWYHMRDRVAKDTQTRQEGLAAVKRKKAKLIQGE